jgi:hypothetical protein
LPIYFFLKILIIQSSVSFKAKGEDMKNQRVLLFLLVGFISAFILGILPNPSVFAQDICGYDTKTKAPIPCPKRKPDKSSTPKPVPATQTPTPTATDTPAPQPGALNSTTAGALLLISHGSVAGCQDNLDTGPNGGGSPISPILLGGGGLLAGILIGLLLPAVQRGLTGGGGARGGIIAPTDDAGIIAPSDDAGIVGPDKPTGGSSLFTKRGGAGISTGNIISGNNSFAKTGGPSNNPAQDAGLKVEGLKEDKWAKVRDDKQDDWAKAQDIKGQDDSQAKVQDDWGAKTQDDWADKWAKNPGANDSKLGDSKLGDSKLNGDG